MLGYGSRTNRFCKRCAAVITTEELSQWTNEARKGNRVKEKRVLVTCIALVSSFVCCVAIGAFVIKNSVAVFLLALVPAVFAVLFLYLLGRPSPLNRRQKELLLLFTARLQDKASLES